LDACSALWNQDVAANVHRNYEIAGLTTAFTSPLVGQLTSTVTTADTTLANAVNGVAGNSGVANAALTGLTSTLGPLLTALGLGTPTASVSATVDLSSVNSILTGDITDSGHIVDINLGAGTITINTAALFDSAHGLNNQAPNTQLLINSTVINALKTAVTSALNNYITSVNNAVRAALAAVKVNVSVVLPLAGFGTGGGVTIAATNVSLASLIAGTATLNATVTCTADALTCVASHAILDPLLSGVVTTVQGLIETPLGNAIAGLLSPTVTTLISNLNTVSSGIVTLLGTVLSGLFGPTSVLSLVVNAQNAPVPALSGHPLPIWAASQPAPSTTPFKTGRYGVSAIELVVAGAISVDLGHSSVGSNDLTP
jgi:hypothetical protein